MPTYVYCLVDKTTLPPAGLLGVDEAAVRWLEVGDLAVWVSDVGNRAPAATPSRALAHDEVVRRALELQTPIPARFGQTFAGDEELAAAVAARSDDWADGLARVAGSVEMTLRVLLDEPAQVPSDQGRAGESGVDYLSRVKARQVVEHVMREGAGTLRESITEAVREWIREEAWTPLLQGSRAISVSHLVAREVLADYRRAVRRFMNEQPTWRVMVSGPWAPYSFTPLRHD
ncbi:MAG: GvpL/GvpF family gas vesicle protein [Gemmatimonadota bacterium]|nr:GvpL/GvpF family gas vesicle protein [Gemmatimonadota bacterium]